MQCIIKGNTLIKLTHYDETKKKAHDSQIVRAKKTQFEPRWVQIQINIQETLWKKLTFPCIGFHWQIIYVPNYKVKSQRNMPSHLEHGLSLF